MSGFGTSKSTTQQSSVQDPWSPAQPALQGILSQVQGNLGNTGLTWNEGNAINSGISNANNWTSQFAPQVSSLAQTLLNGGGATDQAGNVNANYQRYVDQTNPLASNTNYDPYQTPGFKDAIDTLKNDITSQVNGSFAAGGRDFSGANMQTLGRGILQGVAPTIAAQYNANVANQQGAAGNLYNAGNTNAGILAGMQQQKLANQGQGVTTAGQALDASNAGNEAALAGEAQRRGIPVQALGLLAQIGIPIAGLGGSASGTSTTEKQASPLEQIMGIGNTIGGLFGTGKAFPKIFG